MRVAVFSGGLSIRFSDGSVRTNDAFPRLLVPLDSHGLEVTLASRCSSSEEPGPDGYFRLGAEHGINYQPLPYLKNHADLLARWPVLALQSRPAIDEICARADVVVVRFPFPLASVVLSSARRHRRPVVGYWANAPLATTVTNAYEGSGWVKRRTAATVASFLDRRHARVARSLDWNLLTDPTDDRLSRLPNISTVIPSLVRQADLATAPTPRVATEPLKVIFPARLEPVKGVLDLLDAASQLADKGSFIFEVIGDGSIRSEVTRRASASAADIRVRGALPHAEVLAELRSSHVVVMPSYADGTPKTLSEAWASGNALIATKINGLGNYVRHGDSALQISPGDVDGLARGLATLENDEALRQALAAEGLSMATKMTHDAWMEDFVHGISHALDAHRERPT